MEAEPIKRKASLSTIDVLAGVAGGDREDSVGKKSIIKRSILLPQLPLMLIVTYKPRT